MKKDAEEKRLSLLVCRDYKMQTNWLKYLDKTSAEDLSWNKMLYNYSDRLLKFILNVRSNTLPSPDNMRRWHRRGNLVCGLCSRPFVTSSHILAGCPWVLNWENKLPKEDRYTWRHNCVLAVIMAPSFEVSFKNKKTPICRVSPSICFVNSGSTYPRRPRRHTVSGVLHKARDWRFDCDLPEWHNGDSRYVLPHKAVISIDKPDVFLILDTLKLIIFIELTCPMEENMDKWRSEKTSKYSSFSSYLNKGWSSQIYTVEVGVKGCVNNSSFF